MTNRGEHCAWARHNKMLLVYADPGAMDSHTQYYWTPHHKFLTGQRAFILRLTPRAWKFVFSTESYEPFPYVQGSKVAMKRCSCEMPLVCKICSLTIEGDRENWRAIPPKVYQTCHVQFAAYLVQSSVAKTARKRQRVRFDKMARKRQIWFKPFEKDSLKTKLKILLRPKFLLVWTIHRCPQVPLQWCAKISRFPGPTAFLLCLAPRIPIDLGSSTIHSARSRIGKNSTMKFVLVSCPLPGGEGSGVVARVHGLKSRSHWDQMMSPPSADDLQPMLWLAGGFCSQTLKEHSRQHRKRLDKARAVARARKQVLDDKRKDSSSSGSDTSSSSSSYRHREKWGAILAWHMTTTHILSLDRRIYIN